MSLKVILASLAVILSMSGAHAATLFAFPQNVPFGTGTPFPFSITFTDDNGDGFLGFDEIDSFNSSGFASVTAIPYIPGLTAPGSGDNWVFSGPIFVSQTLQTFSVGTGSGFWTFMLVLDPVVVGVQPIPLPASLPLLLGGLGAIVMFVRRRKSAA